MKVALFVHCFFPDHFYGTETYTLAVARNLRAMGHAPVVISAVFPGEPVRDSLITRYEIDHIPVYCIDKNRVPHRRISDTYYQPEMRTILNELVLEVQPDVAHVTHLGNHTAVLLDVLQVAGIPAVATLTDFFGFCFTSRLEAVDGALCSGPDRKRINCIACTLKEIGRNHGNKPLYRWLAHARWASLCAAPIRFLHAGKLAEMVADLVDRPAILAQRYAQYRAAVAPTRFLASAYIANGLRVPVHHMRFGIDIPPVGKVPVAADAPLRFGFIGQLAHHKGPDVLIDAYRRLPSGTAELQIFGSGDLQDAYVEALIERAERHGVHFRGTFPGEQIAEVLATLDFLVIPSRWYENSPLVLLGALASHTPVVVSDVEGMAEFVEHGRNGFLFQRGSVDALEKVMLPLVRDPVGARAMSATTNYCRSTMEMTEDLVAIYNTALENT